MHDLIMKPLIALAHQLKEFLFKWLHTYDKFVSVKYLRGLIMWKYFLNVEKMCNHLDKHGKTNNFGISTTAAININVPSRPHYDGKDSRLGIDILINAIMIVEGFCVLVAFGDNHEGWLNLYNLGIKVLIKPGDVFVFRSSLVLHGNDSLKADR